MTSLRESIIDFIYRSATAPAPVRKRLAPLGGAFFLGVILLGIAAALAADRLLALPPLGSWPASAILALPFLAAGVALWLWSVVQFVRAKGTPVPLNPPPRLIEEGP